VTVQLLERIRRDPVWFCRKVLAFEPWSKRRAVLEAVRDHQRVAVRSAYGVGKTVDRGARGVVVVGGVAGFDRDHDVGDVGAGA
jgi:hypothetical protein